MEICHGFDWMSIMPHWSQCILYSVGNMTWADEDLQIYALHFVSKLNNSISMQLRGFHCIIWYRICILVIIPIYFINFTAILCDQEPVAVANKYQMWSDVIITN